MPHCTLEYSANIPIKFDANAFFSSLHEELSSLGSIQIEKIKSRAVRHEDYYMGNGDPKNAFVYLHVALFEGRSEVARRDISNRAYEVLQRYFSPAVTGLHCSITVEVREIERATFSKLSAD